MRKNKLIFTSIFIASLLAISLFSFFLMNQLKKKGNQVLVRIDGIEVATYPLSEDGEYILNDGTNLLVIEKQKAYMKEANCPDHICMKMGEIDSSGETITCLPNKLTVTVISDTQDENIIY